MKYIRTLCILANLNFKKLSLFLKTSHIVCIISNLQQLFLLLTCKLKGDISCGQCTELIDAWDIWTKPMHHLVKSGFLWARNMTIWKISSGALILTGEWTSSPRLSFPIQGDFLLIVDAATLHLGKYIPKTSAGSELKDMWKEKDTAEETWLGKTFFFPMYGPSILWLVWLVRA